MRFSKKLLTISVLVAISGCNPKSTNDYKSDAERFVASGDYKSAVISYKNAIDKEPNNSNLRYELARLYFLNNDLTSSISEFEKGISVDSNYPNHITVYAKALFYSENLDELVTLDFEPDSIEAKAELNFYQALAHLLINEGALAEQKLKQIKTYQSNDSYSFLSMVQLKALSAPNEALNMLDNYSTSIPLPPERHLIEATIASQIGDFKRAIESYSLFVELFPYSDRAKVNLASINLRLGKIDEAELVLKQVLKKYPKLAAANFLMSYVKLNQNDFESSFLLSEKAMSSGLTNTEVIVIAGISAFKTQKYEQAYRYLSSVETKFDHQHPAFTALHYTKVKLGYVDEAANDLLQIDNDGGLNNKLIDTSEYLIKSGNFETADLLISKYKHNENTDSATISGLASIHLALGEDEKALELLHQSVDNSQESLSAKLTISYIKLKQKKFEEVRELADKYLSQSESKTEWLNLKALAYDLEGNIEKAREVYSEASKTSDVNIPSMLFEAKLSFNNRDIEASLHHVDKILALVPLHLGALTIKSAILEDTEKHRELYKSLNIRNFLDSTSNHKIFIAKIAIKHGEFDVADSAINSIDIFERSNEYWKTLISLQLSKGNVNQALREVSNWIDTRQFSSEPYIIKAKINSEFGDSLTALEDIRKAKNINPGNKALSLIELELLVETGKLDEIKRSLSILDNTLTNHPIALLASGYSDVMNNKFDVAVPKLETSYKFIPKFQTAGILYVIYKDTKGLESATDFLKKHVESMPTDFRSKVLLANEVINDQPSLSKKLYSETILLVPNHTTALNNLAYLHMLDENIEIAKDLITRAMETAPNNVEVLDTAASIYLKANRREKAIELLEKAQQLEPLNDNVKLRLKSM